MAQNNKIIVMIATLIFTTIGYVVSIFVSDVLTDQASDPNTEGAVKDLLDIITTNGLLEGIIWLLICIIVFYGVKQVIDEGENVGPISIYFLLIWLGAVIGLVVGYILWTLLNGGQVTLDDNLFQSLALSLSTALGPSFAAALGVSTKNR